MRTPTTREKQLRTFESEGAEDKGVLRVSQPWYLQTSTRFHQLANDFASELLRVGDRRAHKDVQNVPVGQVLDVADKVLRAIIVFGDEQALARFPVLSQKLWPDVPSGNDSVLGAIRILTL